MDELVDRAPEIRCPGVESAHPALRLDENEAPAGQGDADVIDGEPSLGVIGSVLCSFLVLFRVTGGVERMEPVTLILAALAAGASSGALGALTDEVRDAVKAAYANLRGLAKKRVAGRPDAELALERYPSAPKKWEAVLTDELTEAGADEDAELLAAAKALLELIDQAGAKSGKYNVTISNSKGVYVGDHGFQVNRF